MFITALSALRRNRAAQVALGIATAGVITASAIAPANAATTDFTNTRTACPSNYGDPHVAYLELPKAIDGVRTVGKMVVYVSHDNDTPRYCMVTAGLKNSELPKGTKINAIGHAWTTGNGVKSPSAYELDASAKDGVRTERLAKSTNLKLTYWAQVQYQSKSGTLYASNMERVTIAKN